MKGVGIAGVRSALGAALAAVAGKAVPFFRTGETRRAKNYEKAPGVKLSIEPFDWEHRNGQPRPAYSYRAARREALKTLRREDKKAAKRGRLRDLEGRDA